MMNLLKAYINKNEECARWILTEFCNYSIIEENFLQCSVKDIRKLTAGLLYCAMLKLYPVEKDQIMKYWDNTEDPSNNGTTIGNFALVLITLIFDVKRFVSNMN